MTTEFAQKHADKGVLIGSGLVAAGSFFPDIHDLSSPVGLILTILSLVLKYYSKES